MTTIANVQRRVASINIANGWREESDPHDFHVLTTRLTLCASEVVEAVEEVRNGHDVTETYYPTKPLTDEFGMGAYAPFKPEGVPSELADVAIRFLDTADTLGHDLGAILRAMIESDAAVLNVLPLPSPLTFGGLVEFIRAAAPEERETFAGQTEPTKAIAALGSLFMPITDAMIAVAHEETPGRHLASGLFAVALLADAWGIDLEQAIDEKLTYNSTRGHRHGGKAA